MTHEHQAGYQLSVWSCRVDHFLDVSETSPLLVCCIVRATNLSNEYLRIPFLVRVQRLGFFPRRFACRRLLEVFDYSKKNEDLSGESIHDAHHRNRR